MARTGLTQRQFACAVLATLVSLLSFAGVLQGTRAWWQGQGGSNADAGSLMAVRLIEAGDADVASANTRAAGMPSPQQPMVRLRLETVRDAVQETTQETTQEYAQESVSGFASGFASESASQSAAGYVPVAELSERPVLLRDLDAVLELPASEAASAGGTDAAEMTGQATGTTHPAIATGILLINAQGGVDRLLFEAPGYPRYLEAMLARRFADVRFLPGKVDGKPVPSALRISLQLH